MENKTKTITLYTKEIKQDKKKFYASSAKINDEWYKIKFTQDVKNPPDDRGLYELTVTYDDISLENGKPYIDNEGEVKIGNATLWVRNFVNLRKLSDEELSERNRETMASVFGD